MKNIWFKLSGLLIILFVTVYYFSRSDNSVKISSKDVKKTKTLDIEDKIENVDKISAKEKILQQKEQQSFKSDGWQEVSVDEPDMDVINLNPKALQDKESEIQIQLQTNSYRGEKLLNIKEIFIQSSEFKTKYVALESLGKSKDAKAQEILIDLFDDTEELKLKEKIITSIKPKSSGDKSTNFLISIMADPSLSRQMKDLASINIISMELATQKNVSDSLLQRIPEEWKPRFNALIKRLY